MPAHPTKPKSADDRNLVPVDENYAAPGLDDQMRLFWDKNSKLILIVAALLALAILGNEGRKYLARQHAETVAAAYASSGTDTALRAFLADYPDEPQAGPALLRLADAAYTAGRHAEARTTYEQAAARLATLPEKVGKPFVARARLGAAVSTLLSGQTAEATAGLKKIADDTGLPAAIRAEAMFDLAFQAAAAGQVDEVRALGDQIAKTDPSGPWNERVRSLLARPAQTISTGKTDSTPALTFPLPNK